MNIFYTCTECDHEFEIDVEPITPAQTYGPPENCYPAEGGGFEPETCPECDHPVKAEKVYDDAAETLQASEDDYWEAKAEMMQEQKEYFNEY